MNSVSRIFLVLTLVVPFACLIGCGNLSQPTLVTEGMTDAELQAQFEATDSAEQSSE